ncbi:hypothetical protein [Luteolibacter sp. LG18]|uniref:hypothetical protein n=1 Tax=Luteolibacter sp. LG18 TaxID=2819286 RepID=UPI002B2C809D|nr:hypothetical protein llg_29670 [Luteolibacter sp. LG18]
MKRFLDRLLETGAICWFGMAGLMFLGSLMVGTMRGTLVVGGHMGVHDRQGMISLHDASCFWFGVAAVMAGIGVGVMRTTGKKR